MYQVNLKILNIKVEIVIDSDELDDQAIDSSSNIKTEEHNILSI